MFGETVDYWLLKPLATARHRATEEELDREGCSSLTLEQMTEKLPRILDRFEGHFPISPDLRYLDMGCGSGELTLGLAGLGAKHIVGVDYLPRFVELARRNARSASAHADVQFECADLHRWEPPGRFDVAISFDALEHIDDPRRFLATMGRFLAPGGKAVVSFGPLFHSPFGDHMYEFFRVQVPWRGALFSEQAMMRVRREFYRPTDPATRYREVAGGLNLMRYSEFLRYAAETGWEFEFLRTNAFLRQPLLRKLSDLACRTPGVQDYVVHNVYAVMHRKPDAESQAVEPRERLAA
jgi:SAM-dependent methyltransferase